MSEGDCRATNFRAEESMEGKRKRRERKSKRRKQKKEGREEMYKQ